MRRTTGLPVQAGATTWSVQELADVYSQHSPSLTRRALRYLRDEQHAEDVVQEAFIKVMLAAPELNDHDHLIAYLNKTVTNLCLDIRRAQNRGPLLIAVDSDTSSDVLDDLSHDGHVDLTDALTRAEDAAIVRQAISRLSEVDRAVLLNVHLLQKSTAETAAEFGLTDGTVRNALMRARRNLRTVLETWVIDEETGMTAAEFLSKSYRKAAENSKKIGSAALSLILLVAAFFGFWNNPATAPVQIASPKVIDTTPEVSTPAAPTPVAVAEESDDIDVAAIESGLRDVLTNTAVGIYSLMAVAKWPGLDDKGLPVGFTTNNGADLTGQAIVLPLNASLDDRGTLTTSSQFLSTTDGLNVAIQQSISRTSAGKLTYKVTPFVRINGAWHELLLVSGVSSVEQQADGNFLVVAQLLVDPEATGASFTTDADGVDLKQIPNAITIRILTSPMGSPIFGEAVQILDPIAYPNNWVTGQ